jgi:hypothetical protein
MKSWLMTFRNRHHADPHEPTGFLTVACDVCGAVPGEPCAPGCCVTPAPHEHVEGLFLTPLPECLAPTAAEAAEYLAGSPDFLPSDRLPRAGEPVVLEGAHVHWLMVLDHAHPVTEANTVLMTAPRLGRDHCQGADWANAGGVDPADFGPDEEDVAYLPDAYRLLIGHANAARA